MRIAYVINSVEGGGAALPVPAVFDLLRGHGATVRLFALTPRDRRAVPAMHAAGIDVAVRDGGEKDHLAALHWLDRAIAAWRPDILWTSLTRATLLGQLVGQRRAVPVVSWQHAAYLKPANHRLLRATQSLSALWIADSHSVAALTTRSPRDPARTAGDVAAVLGRCTRAPRQPVDAGADAAAGHAGAAASGEGPRRADRGTRAAACRRLRAGGAVHARHRRRRRGAARARPRSSPPPGWTMSA